MPVAQQPAESPTTHHWEPEPAPTPDLERAVRMGHGKYFEIATIAHNLSEEADAGVKAGTIISIVGNDLPNVARQDYPWADCLEKWMQRGATVRYFAIQPSEKALERLAELAGKAGAGKLQVRRLSPDVTRHEWAGKLAQLWRTFHFVVFENEPQFWAEGYHPAVFTEARDCFYFGPQDVAAVPHYAHCLEQFNLMFEQHGEVLV